MVGPALSLLKHPFNSLQSQPSLKSSPQLPKPVAAKLNKENIIDATTALVSLASAKTVATATATSASVKPASDASAVVVVVSFEACKSCHRFAKKARELFAELCERLPDESNVQLELSINGDDLPKVRRGAFEIAVYDKLAGPDRRQEIWTGLKRGPPRSQKYPDTERVLDDIRKKFE